MFEVVPGLAERIETRDVLASISPRPMMVVSGSHDPYSKDADQVVTDAARSGVTEFRVDGGHALDQERFDAMVAWVVDQVLPSDNRP